jgi:glycosyltransferase involved in cell wall biosynthesis
MKHVCIFIQSLANGGAERVTVTLAGYLVANSYHVTVITMADNKNDFHQLPEGVNRVSLAMAFENNGLRKLTANIERILTLRNNIKTLQPDILIGMMTNSSVMAILACIGLKTKVIVSERNYPARKTVSTFWSCLRKLTYKLADGHAAQTDKTLKWLQTYTKSRNVHVIPNSVKWPISAFSPIIDPAKFVTAENKLILAVGTKLKQKGFDLLLEAFSRISDSYPEWQLAIVGIDKETNSKDYKALIHMTQNFDITDRVIFVGKVGNIGDWYERADIFVLSSRYEGFPNVLIEAMASGCSCVAFDCDTGPRDIIEHNQNGLLVSPENVDDMADTISLLINDNALRNKLSQNAITVRENFSENAILIKWCDLIESI